MKHLQECPESTRWRGPFGQLSPPGALGGQGLGSPWRAHEPRVTICWPAYDIPSLRTLQNTLIVLVRASISIFISISSSLYLSIYIQISFLYSVFYP